MSHPFANFHQVWTAQELIDYAFRNAESKGASIPPTIAQFEKVKRKEVKRIENSSTILVDKLKLIIESVPNLEELPEFYRKLSNLLVNNDDLRQHLGHLNSSIPIISRLAKEYMRKIQKSGSSKEAGDNRVQFFGRSASIIRKLNSSLEFIEDCRVKIKQIPLINLNMPSVVVAGYPNVGKSSIVGQISSAQPEVAPYPFTTKQIYIGIHEDQYKSQFFQVIDTPGILDRPMAERNEIEKQAILALNCIASFVLFIVDPTLSSGYEVDHQIRLYHEIKQDFLAGLTTPIRVVINKMDMATPEEIDYVVEQLQIPKEDVILTNAKEGTNTDIVANYLLDYFQSTNYKR
jgi:nucleolar GTP-binding protein